MTTPKTETTAKPIRVEYFHEIPGVAQANVMWHGRWPMRNGQFPSRHPVGGTSVSDGSMQLGTSNGIAKFRAKGYWASCFPEGDGMIVEVPPERDADAVADDIRECFGWQVKIKRR